MIVLSFWIASLSELKRFFCKSQRWKIIWRKSFHFVLRHINCTLKSIHTCDLLRYCNCDSFLRWIAIAIAIATSTHSSRMRITRLLTVSHSIPCISRGGGPLHSQGEGSASRGCASWWGGGGGGQTPPSPPVNRITDRYKNITLPQTSFAGCKNGCTTLEYNDHHRVINCRCEWTITLTFEEIHKHRKNCE